MLKLGMGEEAIAFRVCEDRIQPVIARRGLECLNHKDAASSIKVWPIDVPASDWFWGNSEELFASFDEARAAALQQITDKIAQHQSAISKLAEFSLADPRDNALVRAVIEAFERGRRSEAVGSDEQSEVT